MAPKMADELPIEGTDGIDRSSSSSIDDIANSAAATDGASATLSPFCPQIKPHPTKSAPYITVSDPIQFNEGLKGKYTVYRVAYDPELDDSAAAFLPHACSTQHRYSSFLTLYKLLATEKPGTILPPLPEKLVKDRFSPACLEERRQGLELFLRRICIHPELRECNIVKSFFEEGSWKRVKKGEIDDEDEEDENVVSTPKAGKKSTIKKWIKDKKTCLSGTLHRSPLDPLFDEMEHYVSALEGGLKRVELQAEYMVKNCEREGSVWIEFGLANDAVGHVDDFIGQTTNEAASDDSAGQVKQTMGHAFHTTSQTSDALATLYQKHHQTLLQNFLLPLRDQLKIVQAAKSALTKRSNRRITYSTALSNVDSKKASLHKYRITQGMENKVLNAEASLSKAELEVETAKRNYDEVSERVLREFDRFRCENATMMHEIMAEFGRFQSEHSEEIARIWRSQHIKTGVVSSGRNYVDAAKVLMEANSNVGGGGHIVNMPMNPPPPVPAENGVHGLQNAIETMGIQGAVRYRDPLPEE